MKKITIILILGVLSFGMLSLLPPPDKCSGDKEYKEGIKKLGNYRLIKDYRVSLKSGNPKKPPSVSYPVSLTEGLTYKFMPIDNSSNKGKLVMELFMNSKKEILFASSYSKNSNKYYPSIEFKCGRTGTYYLSLSFSEGKKGCGVGFFTVKK